MAEREIHPSEDDRQAKVSLWDLVLWMTICGVMSLLRIQLTPPSGSASQQAFGLTYFGMEMACFSTGVTALIVFGRRWWHGLKTDFQPGHWLLCLLGIIGLNWFMGEVVRLTITPWLHWQDFVSGSSSFLLIEGAIQLTFFLVTYLVAAYCMPVRSVWRITIYPRVVENVLLLATVLADIVGTGAMVYRVFDLWKGPLLMADLVLLIAIATWDFRTTNDRRDWLHWWGVITAMLLSGGDLLLRTIYGLGWVR